MQWDTTYFPPQRGKRCLKFFQRLVDVQFMLNPLLGVEGNMHVRHKNLF